MQALAAVVLSVAQMVAPFLDDQTFAVAHVDLQRLDLAPVRQQVAGLLATQPAEPNGATAMLDRLERLAEAMRGAGATDVFYVMSIADMPGPGFAVVPLREGADERAIRWLLLTADPDAPATGPAEGPTSRPGVGMQVRRIRGALVLAVPETLERLEALEPVDRPELAEALAAVEGQAARIALIPPDDARRVLEATMPQLPPQLGGGPVTVLTRGLQWAAGGVGTEGGLHARAVAQATDAEAAKALDAFVEHWMAGLARMAAEGGLANAAEIAALLDPQVEGDQLRLDLPAGQVARMAELLAPSLREARAEAERAVTMSHMKQLGHALHGYAIDHDDTLPPDLQTLVDRGLFSPDLLQGPEGRPRYVYVQPGRAMRTVTDAQRQILAYEAFDEWGEGINVLFIDGHVEHVAERARFERLLKESLEGYRPPAQQ